jgi:cardiolipin synthase
VLVAEIEMHIFGVLRQLSRHASSFALLVNPAQAGTQFNLASGSPFARGGANGAKRPTPGNPSKWEFVHRPRQMGLAGRAAGSQEALMQSIDAPVSDEPANWRDPEPFHCEAAGHSLHFHPSGRDRWQALIGLIDGARHSLQLCFYIFAEDGCGHLVRDALIGAARRGVSVVLIVDSFGCDASDAFFQPFIEAGGSFHRFMPRLTRRYLIRNHQKMVIADEDRAMIGGFNIEDSYFAPPERDGWQDLGLVLRGPVVQRLVDWFDRLTNWTANPRKQFLAIRRLVREWDPGSGPVRLLMGGPTKGLSSWARCVSEDLAKGQRLDMIMAYFSPAGRLLRSIERIARQGQARLVFAARSDNGATIGASRSLYEKLLRQGARIWEFSPARLHTKLIVLDDAVYIGSANFDARSLYINLELMLKIEDAALAKRMREFVAAHIPASLEITPALHRRRRTILNRIRWSLSWYLVSVVDYTVSRKLNLGL